MPCRGSGQLISQLGGFSSTVQCPWCEGGGVRLSSIDAQAHWLNERLGESPSQSDGGVPDITER
jgi:hypothetical protein